MNNRKLLHPNKDYLHTEQLAAWLLVKNWTLSLQQWARDKDIQSHHFCSVTSVTLDVLASAATEEGRKGIQVGKQERELFADNTCDQQTCLGQLCLWMIKAGNHTDVLQWQRNGGPIHTMKDDRAAINHGILNESWIPMSERSQSQKITYSVIPFIWHLEKAQL